MIVIIAGSGSFRNYELLKQKCDFFFYNKTPDLILSGGQVSTDEDTGEKYGADYLGEKYAKERNIPLEVYPALWDVFGKHAGPIRNKEMTKIATHLIAFWDGYSRGTANMVTLAREFNVQTRIVNF